MTLRDWLIAAVIVYAACPLRAGADEYTLSGPDTVRWQGAQWRAIDDAGGFVFRPDHMGEAPLPKPNVHLQEVLNRQAWTAPVRCRLVDYLDATARTHAFRDDGKSRVLDLPGGRFRVTGAPKGFELCWYAFDIRTADRAGRPHLLVAELSNDRERYTTLTLTVPRLQEWSPPHAGQERVRVDAMEISQEPLWYEPDVGLDVYTGRDLPATGESFLSHFIFYPKTARMKLTVSSSGWAQPVEADCGGAVSKVWVFEILDDLAERRPQIAEPAGERKRHVGVYATHPWYFLAHYGVPPHTVEQRRESLENLCDLLAFCGMNLVEFNAINGSDRAGRAWYPGSYYPQLGADLLRELPPVAKQRGIDLIPVVTSLTVPGRIDGDKPNEYGFSRESLQKPANPNDDPRAFDRQAPDPLRPETQAWMVRLLREIGQRCAEEQNVLGLGFRVNGKIGTCYIAGEDKSGRELKIVPARRLGYSAWNLKQFEKDSGLEVPDDSWEAYEWLRGDRERWDQWLDFRCRRTRDFWLAARDAVRAMRPDWNLYVLTDLPSEVQATNVDWPGPDAADAERVTLDLLREHGFDPRLYRRDEGIVIQRVMMADMDRFFSKWGPPFGSHPLRYRDFHEQAFLPGWYRTPAGSAVEVYRNYWEEPFHPDGEFGPDGKGFGLRTATATPMDRSFFRPAMLSLRYGNNDTIVHLGWQRPVLGHEHDFRGFSRFVRSLPVVEPKEIATDNAKVYAAMYGDVPAVMNLSGQVQEASISLPAGLDRESLRSKCILDIQTVGGLLRIRCRVQPWSGRVLTIE